MTPSESPSTTGLDQLPRHQNAIVVSVREAESVQDRDVALRLVEIGFLPGERVSVIAHGHPGREPLAVRIGGTTFALRRHEAEMIQVRYEQQTAAAA